MIMYGLIGFLLIRIPKTLVSAIYGSPDGCSEGVSWTLIDNCILEKQPLSASLEIFGKILMYVNSFVTFVCVILVIYAGWLVLISAGDEEKLKKAKNTVLYILIGLVILVASHLLFRFFIMQ